MLPVKTWVLLMTLLLPLAGCSSVPPFDAPDDPVWEWDEPGPSPDPWVNPEPTPEPLPDPDPLPLPSPDPTPAPEDAIPYDRAAQVERGMGIDVVRQIVAKAPESVVDDPASGTRIYTFFPTANSAGELAALRVHVDENGIVIGTALWRR